MKKAALFVFNGDPMCFIHVLLNALDMKEKKQDEMSGHPSMARYRADGFDVISF